MAVVNEQAARRSHAERDVCAVQKGMGDLQPAEAAEAAKNPPGNQATRVVDLGPNSEREVDVQNDKALIAQGVRDRLYRSVFKLFAMRDIEWSMKQLPECPQEQLYRLHVAATFQTAKVFQLHCETGMEYRYN